VIGWDIFLISFCTSQVIGWEHCLWSHL